MRLKLISLAVAGALVLGGGMSALAYAAQSNSATPAPIKQQVTAPAAGTSQQVKGANEATEKGSGIEKESTTEKKAEEKGDKNLPGGGHQDPDGANVNHQFEGIE